MFYDEVEYDDLEDVSRQQIENSSDLAWLSDIYILAANLQLSITEFIKAKRDAGLGHTDWLERASGKVAFLRLGMKWIEGRIITLGGVVPYSPTDGRNREIRRLKAEIEALKVSAGV